MLLVHTEEVILMCAHSRLGYAVRERGTACGRRSTWRHDALSSDYSGSEAQGVNEPKSSILVFPQ
jgi:hypothetical protein